ncbi:hypothetical protein BJ138DRAFT_147442 [Hygrophoropsis aurantiaca]|uniref:Uncharacterized protein n=1 Tax=Hygrophoropsis aurantiaca TaxID=72124 RepID=A0ACB8AQJ6_9AGAM|nr:hypothetical protein BJ138DRAFT_147442 [Hygrophoropsis aurantiaca]
MGRPLFSKAFQTAPAVREPETPCPYEKWSYLNDFDPDSDEFFESDHAVYEDCLGPAVISTSEDEEERETRDMVVIRVGNSSPTSSEESLSDRASPMADGPEDPAHLLADAFHDLRRVEQESDMPSDSGARVQLARRVVPTEVRWTTESGLSVARGPDDTSILGFSPTRPLRQSSHRSLDRGTITHHEYARRTGDSTRASNSASVPVPAIYSRRTASVDEYYAHSPSSHTPSTPPSRQNHFSPSPPPTVTPRLYSWSSRHSTLSSSPTGTGPLTNASARMSYTHISPTLVRVRDVMT